MDHTFGNYNEIDCIQKAMKVTSEIYYGKSETIETVITEFKVLKEVDSKTFAETK